MSDRDPDLPEDLSDRALRELGRLYAPPATPSEPMRDALFREARRRMAPRPARRRTWTAAIAAAAAAVVLVLVPDWGRRDGAPGPEVAALDSARDRDGSGRVDILDAFHLARELEAGGSTGGDVDGDGRVDARDVEELARLAVRIDR